VKQPHIPLPEFVRYVLVGGFNTVFGYGVFALLNWLFTGLSSYSYMYAALLANLITVTVAFLGYKWIVFRTRGNYLVEWIRCVGVYSGSIFIGLAGLPILVSLLRRYLNKPVQAPYIAAALLMVITVIFSFFGHKTISFRSRPVAENGGPEPRVPPELPR
jgi:putative flippase GtrA